MIVILTVLLIVTFIGGIFYISIKLNARKFRRATVEMQPVLQLVNGRADRPFRWLGEFEGRPIRIVFNSSSTGKTTSYWFELIMTFQPGGERWAIRYHKHSLLSRGPDGWLIDTKQKQLAHDLEQAGALQLADHRANQAMQFKYDPKPGDLMMTHGLKGFNFNLNPAVIQAELELLRDLGHAARRAIGGPVPSLSPAAS